MENTKQHAGAVVRPHCTLQLVLRSTNKAVHCDAADNDDVSMMLVMTIYDDDDHGYYDDDRDDYDGDDNNNDVDHSLIPTPWLNRSTIVTRTSN